MGKGVPAPHWETIAEKGFQLVYGSTANLFTDRHGNYIGYGPEAWELVGVPEPETFQVLPWDGRVARVWCTCFRNREDRDGPGAFLTSDCRGNLRRIQAELEGRTGMHLRAGMEPEMMWLKLDADGEPSVEGKTKPYCYHIDQFSELQPIIHKMVEYGQKLRARHDPGRPRGRAGPDRAELRLRPGGEDGRQPLDLPPGREAGRTRGGRLPVLHAEAVHGRVGERVPHNISLWKGDENTFLPDTDDMHMPSKVGLHAVGGILEHLRGAHVHHRADGELVPPLLGDGLLGAGVRRLGLPEPHDRAPDLVAGPLRVPLGRLLREPVPRPRRR